MLRFELPSAALSTICLPLIWEISTFCAIGAVIAIGRSVSSVTAIGGRGFVGLLQGLLELLGLLVILGFCGVGFADGGGGVGGPACKALLPPNHYHRSRRSCRSGYDLRIHRHTCVAANA